MRPILRITKMGSGLKPRYNNREIVLFVKIFAAGLAIVFFVAASEMLQSATAQEQTGREENDESASAVAAARHFILSRLPSLGIHVSNELDLHTDMVVAKAQGDYSVEFSVMDQNGQPHDGSVEISNGQITSAIMDGKSIL